MTAMMSVVGFAALTGQPLAMTVSLCTNKPVTEVLRGAVWCF